MLILWWCTSCKSLSHRTYTILDQRQNSGDEIPGQKPHSSSMRNDRILLRSKISGKKSWLFYLYTQLFYLCTAKPQGSRRLLKKGSGRFRLRFLAGEGKFKREKDLHPLRKDPSWQCPARAPVYDPDLNKCPSTRQSQEALCLRAPPRGGIPPAERAQLAHAPRRSQPDPAFLQQNPQPLSEPPRDKVPAQRKESESYPLVLFQISSCSPLSRGFVCHPP